ncbi:cytochrome-c oxidase [Mesobacillus subterraneus]|uniref:cytochrome-c oxidase n=1 Tax=Mesobacillus subterraneus TaxID=285983 RepID=UPI002040E66B|nr:cytochrome-c oxidase [Mesobacillus subterraneus]MCM3664519.1 cytochrome-c oxidase [Mesobacillus subterraneus]MCM3683964.1 cytochrome-c oxidase [Mesobacillus subterraneus]
MSIRFFKVAAVYFVIAIILGIVMGIMHDFSLTSVHAHLNLLGWVSMALFGTIYYLFPAAGNSKLANTHFWLHNLGVPVMQGGITLTMLTENDFFTVFAIIGSLVVVLGGILFAVNVFKHVKS